MTVNSNATTMLAHIMRVLVIIVDLSLTMMENYVCLGIINDQLLTLL